MEEIKKFIDIAWMQPDGTVEDSDEIKLFETREDAEEAVDGPEYEELWDSSRPDIWADARSRAIESGRNYEWKEAWHAAFAAARDAAFDAAKDTPLFTRRRHAFYAAMDAAYQFVMCNICGDLQVEEKHREYVRKRFDIWRHGYGVLCEINGVLYVYKKI